MMLVMNMINSAPKVLLLRPLILPHSRIEKSMAKRNNIARPCFVNSGSLKGIIR